MKAICYCKKCERTVQHNATEEANRFQCIFCGTTRFYAKKFGAGDFPELTFEENEDIHEARANGFGSCFPAYPDAEAQARRTLKAAREYLQKSRE